MNWLTRFRRWVRIRMPPVRDASTKPIAATVLPDPVACSNQKRRLAPGSSGASSTTSSSLRPRAPPQSTGSSSGSSTSARARARPRRRRWPTRPGLPSGPAPLTHRRSRRSSRRLRRRGAVRAPVRARALELGHERGERSRKRVHLVRVELRPVGELGLVVVEQALEPEHQREVAAPLDRRRLVARRRSPRARRRPRGGGPFRGRAPRGVSPSSRIGSRANSLARSISALESVLTAFAAGSLVSAMKPLFRAPR